MTTIRNIGRILVLVAAGSTAGIALAQGTGTGPGPGYGPGYGMGPGYGHHMGPGYGPHMGSGGGMGHGMMPGGPGFGPEGGPRMMHGRWERMAQALGLSEDQRAKVRGIMEDTRRKNWDVLGQIQSERFKLREMMRGDNVDPGAAVEQKSRVDDLKRQVMRSRLEARNQVLALLTPEQREKARSFRMGRMGARGNG